jgi:very-short-patch-repair endonuclease
VTGELGEVLERQVGVISVRQAARHLSRGVIRNHLQHGRWQRPHRGVLVTHNGTLTENQRPWVASLAVGNGQPAPLGGLTALRAHGLTGFTPTTTTVLLPASQQRRNLPAGITVLRTTALPARDIFPGRPPRSRAPRSLVDAAAHARTDREARGIIASCFQQRLVRLDDVLDVIERLPRVRRRQLIVATARDAAAGATSLSELDFLCAIRAAGLPEPTLQHRRRDADGRWRWLDAYFAEYGLHVEVDGAQHRDPRQAWDDMARQNALWRAGDRVLRVPAWLVRDHPEIVVAQVRAALLAAGWPG